MINEESSVIQQAKEKIQREEAELAFMSATRNQESDRLNGAMQRCELYEFILRLAHSWVARVYSENEKLAPHLEEFIKIFVKPYYENSIIRL